MSNSLIPIESRLTIAAGGIHLQVPHRTAKLLFISHDPAPSHSSGYSLTVTLDMFDGEFTVELLSPDEPSTIYTAMPLKRPPDPAIIPRLPYFPSYAGLSPDQKWVYLNWLTDVTQPINIGYVFIYYYGLERHLLNGDFERAFDEILLLRQSHAGNSSFDTYSRSALRNAAKFRKSPDRLKQLYHLAPPERFDDNDLILAHELGYDLGIEGMIRLLPSLKGVQKRYIKSHPQQYRQNLEAVLTEEFGQPFLPLASRYTLSEIPKVERVLFANISFPREIRTPPLPSFLKHEPFLSEATRVFGLAHDRTKAALAVARKSTVRPT